MHKVIKYYYHQNKIVNRKDWIFQNIEISNEQKLKFQNLKKKIDQKSKKIEELFIYFNEIILFIKK